MDFILNITYHVPVTSATKSCHIHVGTTLVILHCLCPDAVKTSEQESVWALSISSGKQNVSSTTSTATSVATAATATTTSYAPFHSHSSSLIFLFPLLRVTLHIHCMKYNNV